jgi:hypothetical protein
MGNILRYFRIEGAPQEINDSTSSEGEIVCDVEEVIRESSPDSLPPTNV